MGWGGAPGSRAAAAAAVGARPAASPRRRVPARQLVAEEIRVSFPPRSVPGAPGRAPHPPLPAAGGRREGARLTTPSSAWSWSGHRGSLKGPPPSGRVCPSLWLTPLSGSLILPLGSLSSPWCRFCPPGQGGPCPRSKDFSVARGGKWKIPPNFPCSSPCCAPWGARWGCRDPGPRRRPPLPNPRPGRPQSWRGHGLSCRTVHGSLRVPPPPVLRGLSQGGTAWGPAGRRSRPCARRPAAGTPGLQAGGRAARTGPPASSPASMARAGGGAGGAVQFLRPAPPAAVGPGSAFAAGSGFLVPAARPVNN